ncbi:flagellar hook capping FlgD N-terminal domain-containing protein [Curtobacterium ammoniigenes]|uniref:flagellar hook capping FlgD N-terminal domain-containing protein n=1 Tax=Curtobacterium ammoniigenes TaxID=395387 RepID=UPI0008331604|nr:flagellar hook capping FlgD N-terminal domain-containing protein [Curtobacterium ammoniigenes]
MTAITPTAQTVPVIPAVPATAATAAANASQNSMTASDFMQLLVAQLQNQDPSQPMDSSQMVQQTTELGMMQEMTSMQSTSSSALTYQAQAAAADLIGKTISYTDTSGAAASGIVTGASFSGSSPTVSVNGTTVALSGVLGVTQTPSA